MRIKFTTGFSLIEVLVALSIVGLVAVTILEGSMMLFNNYVHINRKFDGLQSARLPEYWFRSSVESLTVSFEQPFIGKGDYFEGYSLASVSFPSGTSTKMRWSLYREGDWIELRVSQNNQQELKINRWQAEDAKFLYYGTEKKIEREWPAAEDQLDRLPHAIQLQLNTEDSETLDLLVSTELRRFSKPDYRELL